MRGAIELFHCQRSLSRLVARASPGQRRTSRCSAATGIGSPRAARCDFLILIDFGFRFGVHFEVIPRRGGPEVILEQPGRSGRTGTGGRSRNGRACARHAGFWFLQNTNVQYLSYARLGKFMLSNNINKFINPIKIPFTFRMYPTIHDY